jgi:hypothetical protein
VVACCLPDRFTDGGADLIGRSRSVATRVIHPLIREQIYRSGISLLPLVFVASFALGFIIVGQILVVLIQHGQIKLFSTVMAPVIILFFLAQKAFVEGVTLTGVKG